MSIRQYDLDVNVETSNLPGDGGTPTLDGHVIVKAYADDTYTPRVDVWGGVTNIVALKAVDATSRANETIIWVSGKEAFYEYNSSSAAAPDDDEIVQPDDVAGNGRWIKKIDSTGGAGSSGAAGIETVEQKGFVEHDGGLTPDVANSLCESFNKPQIDVQAWLMEDYTNPATSIAAAINPTWLDSSNKNFDGVTGWTAFDAEVTNIDTEASTKKLGSDALSFDKSAGASTLAGIYKDLTAASALNLVQNTEVFIYVNMPSVTNFTNFKLRIAGTAETDVSTNYREYTVTLNSAGGAIATGWNLIKFDISSGQGSAAGTGWTINDLGRVFGFFITTSSAAQTYTNVVLDSWVHSHKDYALLAQVGDVFPGYDTSNVADLQVDAASAAVRGIITLTAALGNNFSGGTGSTFKRATADVSSANFMRMTDGLSGAIADKQTVIRKVVLPDNLPSAEMVVSVSQYSDLFLTVTDVDSTTQIKVSSSADLSGEFLSGDKYMVFEQIYGSGKVYYAYRDLKVTLNNNATFGSSKITLQNSGTNAGIAVGDLIVKEEVNCFVSLASKTANESFGSALAHTDALLSDIGVPYPSPDKVFASWRLGGASGLTNRKGIGASLSEAGTPANKARSFMNGFFGAGAWASSGDRLYLATGSADELIGDAALGYGVFSISLWFYPVSNPANSGIVVAHSTTNLAGNSWSLQHTPSGTLAFIASGNTTLATIGAGSLTTGMWHHVALIMDDTVESRVYVDGVKTTGTVPAHAGDAVNSMFSIGDFQANGSHLANAYVADVVAWSGYKLTDGDVTAIYKSGRGGGLLGQLLGLRHRYEKAALSGQKLSVRADLKRNTDAVDPQIDLVAAIKK